MWRVFLLAALLPTSALATPVRDSSVPMVAVAHYDGARLLGHWFEVAQTPSFLEQDCHGTTADVARREDSRMTLKIACHKTSPTGPVLPIEGVLAETDPGIFDFRPVHLPEIGDPLLVVLWQSADDSLATIGAPQGELGWIWSKSAHPDPQTLQMAKQALVSVGYSERAIKPVEQAP